MTSKTEPNSGLNYGWSRGEAGWNIGADVNWLLIGMYLGFNASTTANAPTGSEIDGTNYLVGTSPTGAFAGKANNLASKINGTWVFAPPKEATPIKVAGIYKHYESGAWTNLVL